MLPIVAILIIVIGGVIGVCLDYCGVACPPLYWTLGAITAILAMAVGFP